MYKLKSRKLWVAAVTSMAMLICGLVEVDLDVAQCAAVVVPAVAYILGESMADSWGTRG